MKKIRDDDLLRAKEGFYHRGESVAEWARRHGFAVHAVYQVLSGRCHAVRGDSHRIAVALGLKPGEYSEGEAHMPAEPENVM